MTIPTDSLDERIAEARKAYRDAGYPLKAASGIDWEDCDAYRVAAALRLHALLEEKAGRVTASDVRRDRPLIDEVDELAGRNLKLQEEVALLRKQLATARADALEEAAKECDGRVYEYKSARNEHANSLNIEPRVRADASAFTSEGIAETIRSLKSKP